MATVELTQGKVAIVDEADLPLVTGHSWCASCYTLKSGEVRWWAVARINRKMTQMHRVLLGLKPGDPNVDHIDRDGLNNRRENLRLATQTQNNANSIGHPTHRRSRYKGVSWDRDDRHCAGGFWRATVTVNGKRIARCAATEIEAAVLYNQLALTHFGEFARLNEP